MQLTARTLAFCLTSGALLFAADYRYAKIDVPNSTLTSVNGVNARGDLVGRYDNAKGGTHGFLRRNGVFTTIGVPQATFTAARGINARGDIVGRADDAAGHQHGFLLRDGQFTLVDFPGASATVALGVNNAGDVTGQYVNPSGAESGFLLRDGAFHKVRVIDSCGTEVWMAQDDGKVSVGEFCSPTDHKIHGYLRPRPDNFQNIDFAGADCTSARWINEKDDIVGAYGNTLDECSASQFHGFVLRQGLYAAIDFPGSMFTDAQAINDYGVIVGDFTDTNGVVHGFQAVPLAK